MTLLDNSSILEGHGRSLIYKTIAAIYGSRIDRLAAFCYFSAKALNPCALKAAFFPMNRLLHSALALAASTCATQAAIVWTGATSADPFDDSNWDFSGSAVTAVDSNVSVADDITITNGNIAIPNLTGQVRLQIGNGFTMTLDNSILGLVAGGNDGTGGEPGSTGVNINVTNGSQLNPFFVVNNVSVDIDATSSATFGGGGNPVNIATINLTTGSTLSFLAETPAAFTSEHLSKITVDGSPAVDGVNITISPFNGALGSTISVIPEPSGIALLGLAGIAMIFRRRK